MDSVEAARKGEENAFLRLFDEHHRSLFRFAHRLTGSVADAEDVVQECFLGLLRPGCGYDARRTSIRTYLFGAVRNQSLKRIQTKCNVAPELEAGQSPETYALRVELESAVEHAVKMLPETQREVLILAHYEQMPLAEIAQVLEIEVGAVKSRLQRARGSLKETLAEYAGSLERKR